MCGKNCETLSKVAEHAWQIESLRVEWFVWHEGGQAMGIRRKISRRDGPAFNRSPSEYDRNFATIAKYCQPASVFVGEIEWEKQLLAVVQFNEQSNPFTDQLHNSFERGITGTFAAGLDSEIIAFPGAVFSADLNGDLIVGVEAD